MDTLAKDIQRRKLQIKARRRASQGGPDYPPPPPPVSKGHRQEGVNLAQSGQTQSDEEDYMDILTKAVERGKLQIRDRRTSGSLNHPAPPPPVQNPPSPPPAAPAHREWTKRQATGPPPPPPVSKGHEQEDVDLDQSGQTHSSEEDNMDILTKAVERRKIQIRARRASGSVNHPAPPPVQNTRSPPPAAPAHRAWTKRRATGPPTGFSGTSTSTKPPALKKPPMVCVVCGVRCMSAFHLKQHEEGRKHRNKMAYAAGQINVRCNVCDVPLLSKVNVEEHYAGKQHLHRVFCSGSGAN